MKKCLFILAAVSGVVLSVSSTIVFSDISREEVSAWCVAYDLGSNTYYTCKDESAAICEAMANGTLMSCPGLLYVEKGPDEVVVTPVDPSDPKLSN